MGMQLPKKHELWSMKYVLWFFLIPIILASLFISQVIHADEVEDLQKKINELNKARELSVNATKPLEGQLEGYKRQLAQIQANLDNLSNSITQKEKDLKLREEKLASQQALLASRVKSYYIRSFLTSPFLILMSSNNTSELFRELSYQQAQAREDHRIITTVTGEMLDLLTQKEKLETDKSKLADLQTQVDKNAQFLGGEIKKAQAYQAELTSKIVALTARQQEILNQRLAALNIPRSAGTSLGGCTDDRSVDPGFSPRLAFFTYGVPNRVGLNQYGADGRAKNGQNVEQILAAYYSNYELKKDYSTGININVNGYGSFNIEDYVKRIYEMPSSFSMEALKAQAVAARSYALAYTNNGSGSICATDSCQVFKPDPKGGAWEEAVNATRGWVMVSGGSPIKAWFSSTHGGYILSSGEIGWSSTSWTKHGTDTVSGSASGFSDLAAGAYDKASPWFYCDWGSRASYNKTAWLKPSEVADIVNTLLLVKADSSTTEHLYQTDKSNPAGTDNWDEGRVRQELRNKGITPYENVSSVSVGADFSSGATTQVSISGDGGSQSFAGSDFKNRFNLRAPASLQIVGPLFNVEMK